MRLGSARDVGLLLKCSVRHVRRLEKVGLLGAPRVTLGRLVRYDLDALESHLATLRERQARAALAPIAGGAR